MELMGMCIMRRERKGSGSGRENGEAEGEGERPGFTSWLFSLRYFSALAIIASVMPEGLNRGIFGLSFFGACRVSIAKVRFNRVFATAGPSGRNVVIAVGEKSTIRMRNRR